MDNNLSENKSYSNQVNFPVDKYIEGNNKLVLDVGCGAGIHGAYFRELGHTVDGITLSENEKRSSEKSMRNVYIYNLENGLPKDLNDTFDYIFCSHVIEHIAYPEKLLLDIKSKLNSNGKLIIAVPNALQYNSRISFLKGVFPEHDSGIWDYTHLRWYTPLKMRRLLEKFEFRIMIEDYDVPMPMNSIFKIFPKYITNYIRKLLKLISPGLFASQLIYVAQND